MPEKMKTLLRTLGIDRELSFEELRNAGGLNPGQQVSDIDALFPRIVTQEADTRKKEQNLEKKKDAKLQKSAPAPENVLIGIDDFAKIQLKTAKVLEAEKVEGTEKLLRLQIEVGEEKRQIVSGIAQYYKPEELVGKIIIIVSNLKPAKIRGVESFGMLLAAKVGDTLRLATIDTPDFPSGIQIG